eukprot:5070199-Pleurochrysis_carterae.AAC.4
MIFGRGCPSAWSFNIKPDQNDAWSQSTCTCVTLGIYVLMKCIDPCLAPGRLPKCLLGGKRSNPTTRCPKRKIPLVRGMNATALFPLQPPNNRFHFGMSTVIFEKSN